MTDIQKTLRRLGCLAILASILSACATTDFGGFGGGPSEQRARSMAADGRYEDAAGVYIGLATEVGGMERDRLTLLAIEQWLLAGDGRRARNALRSVPEPVGGELLWLWSIDAAALALWEGDPDDALSLLEPLSRTSSAQ